MPSLKQHLESKTNAALLILLSVIVGLTLAGKLTTEAVDAIKWVGGTFFAVRGIANLPGSKPNV